VIEFFRLGVAKYRDSLWTGEGGLYVDGRWHQPGRRIIYTAQSLSLAQLEVLVHIADRRQMPELVCGRGRIPEQVIIQTLEPGVLSGEWRRFAPYSAQTQSLGSQWLAAASSAVLKVPSALSSSEWNFLLNPAHPDFQTLTLQQPEPFAMDPRVP